MGNQPDIAGTLIHSTMPFLICGIVLAAGLLVAGLLVRKFRGTKTKPATFPYVACSALLSEAEQRFFAALSQAVNGQYWIFPKVALDDVLEVRRGLSRSEYQTALNRINRKHIDFVLCTPEDYKVVVLVELDDSSHQRSDRQERDRFVDEAAKAAGLTVVHVKAAGSYDPETLAKQIPGPAIPSA